MTTTRTELRNVLIRLLGDVDDDMEFAGTVWKSKDRGAKDVQASLDEALDHLEQLLAEQVRLGKIQELRHIHGCDNEPVAGYGEDSLDVCKEEHIKRMKTLKENTE